MIPRLMVAALCVFGPLTCVAHGGNINGEATYISFSVPGALGTYPMGINASMTVTGYYNVGHRGARFFARGGWNVHHLRCGGRDLDRAGGHQCRWEHHRVLRAGGGDSASISQVCRRAYHHLRSAPTGSRPASTDSRPDGSTARKHQRL